MAEIPNLAGVATKDLVETIGTGRFQAPYINWSRTLNLLHHHAPGWIAELVADSTGSVVWSAPVGAYLMIRFVHTDNTTTPAIPQAIMDNRNFSIPYEKITARDITDTQRRGTCMAAAFIFGLGYELWAKMPLETGYTSSESDDDQKENIVMKPAKTKTAPKDTAKSPVKVVTKKEEKDTSLQHEKTEDQGETSEDTFRILGLKTGLSTYSIDGLLQKLEDEGTDILEGIQRLRLLTPEKVEVVNKSFEKKAAASKNENW